MPIFVITGALALIAAAAAIFASPLPLWGQLAAASLLLLIGGAWLDITRLTLLAAEKEAK